MKRTGVCLLIVFVLLSGGCGAAREEEAFEKWRGQVAAAGEICFDAVITAHWEDAAAEFSVSVRHQNGETVAAVTAPETIAGITFRRGEKSDRLEFDDLILELDAGHDHPVAPCEAPALLLKAVADGWPQFFGHEGGYDTVAIEALGGETVTLRRDASGVPVYAEIARNGVTELTLSIEHWQMKE